MKTGVELIAAERKRQVSVEGWTAVHDDKHERGELLLSASDLLAVEMGWVLPSVELGREGSCWGLAEKHHDPIRRLTIAGALIAAEIDRLLRMEDDDG